MAGTSVASSQLGIQTMGIDVQCRSSSGRGDGTGIVTPGVLSERRHGGRRRRAFRHRHHVDLDLGEFDAFQWMLAHEAFSPTNPPGPEERADSQSDWANNYYGNQIAAAVDAASLNVTTETNVVEVTARIALEAGQLCLATGSTLVNPERCGR